MALIRHAQARTLARDAYVLDLGDLKQQADELKASAEQEAVRIVGAAHKERDRILEGSAEQGRISGHSEGHATGLAEGRTTGREEAFAENSEKLARLAEGCELALQKFEQAREELVFNAQEDGLRLVLEIARRVTLRSAAIDRDGLRERLAESLGRVLDPSRLVVRINPDDRELVSEIAPQLISRLSDSSQSEIIDDTSLMPGDVVVSSGRGWIDTSISAQLDRVINELMPGFDTAPSPSPLDDTAALPEAEAEAETEDPPTSDEAGA